MNKKKSFIQYYFFYKNPKPCAVLFSAHPSCCHWLCHVYTHIIQLRTNAKKTITWPLCVCVRVRVRKRKNHIQSTVLYCPNDKRSKSVPVSLSYIPPMRLRFSTFFLNSLKNTFAFSTKIPRIHPCLVAIRSVHRQSTIKSVLNKLYETFESDNILIEL